MNDLVKRLRAVVDDYDRDAADAAEQGEVWPHDPHTEVDLPVSLVRACADRIEALEAERDRLREALARTEGYILRRNYTMALEAIRAALSPTPER